MVQGGTAKRKVYQDVTASKVIIGDAKYFAIYANSILEIQVEYFDKSDIFVPKLIQYILKVLCKYIQTEQANQKLIFIITLLTKNQQVCQALDYALASTPDSV